MALHLLRMLEEMLLKGATHNLIVRTRSEVALYVLNHKRAHLRELESRFQIAITVNADASVGAAQPFLIEKGEMVHSVEAAKAIAAQSFAATPVVEEDEADDVEDIAEDESEDEAEAVSETESSEDDREEAPSETEAREGGDDAQRRGRGRRRRGRGGRGREDGRENREPREPSFAADTAEHPVAHDGDDAVSEVSGSADGRPERVNGEQAGDSEHRRRRRGRRGGRRNRRGREGEPGFAPNGGEQSEPQEQHGSHEQAEQAGVEPEVADAVADLGGPVEAPAAPDTRMPEPFEPVGREAAPPVEAPPETATPTLHRARAGAPVLIRCNERRSASIGRAALPRPSRPFPSPSPPPPKLPRRKQSRAASAGGIGADKVSGRR